MRNTLLFFALLSICLSSDISSDDYFLAPLPLNISDPDHIGAIFTIGSSMGVGWHTDRDSVDIYLYYDDDHYDYIIRDTAANAIWWIVELPDNFSDDMTDVWLAMCAPDDPKDCYALSQKIMMQSPEDVESTTSSTFTTLVETPVIISTLTATFTTSFTSAPSGQYSSTQAEDISDTHSNNTLWVGVVAGLAVVCGAMVLSLAGFCFYRNRTSSRKEHQDVPVFNSNSVRSLAEHTEPAPPFTPEMGMSRQFPDSKPAITAHQPLTALPSTEERSTPHTSVVSELA